MLSCECEWRQVFASSPPSSRGVKDDDFQSLPLEMVTGEVALLAVVAKKAALMIHRESPIPKK